MTRRAVAGCDAEVAFRSTDDEWRVPVAADLPIAKLRGALSGRLLDTRVIAREPDKGGEGWIVTVGVPGPPSVLDLGQGWLVVLDLKTETIDHGSADFFLGAANDARRSFEDDPGYCTRGVVRLVVAPASDDLVKHRESWSDVLPVPTPACSATHEGVLGYWFPAELRRPLDVELSVRSHPPLRFRLVPEVGDNYTEVEVILSRAMGEDTPPTP